MKQNAVLRVRDYLGHIDRRDDNLLCLAAVVETALVIKTVMHHFSWETGS